MMLGAWSRMCNEIKAIYTTVTADEQTLIPSEFS